jgi:hypothetical protein
VRYRNYIGARDYIDYRPGLSPWSPVQVHLSDSPKVQIPQYTMYVPGSTHDYGTPIDLPIPGPGVNLLSAGQHHTQADTQQNRQDARGGGQQHIHVHRSPQTR